MSLANVNIGAAANDGTGDPLRSAFRTINQNFANLEAFASNANITYNAGVESVAGRTGNVVLTVADIVGAASTGYVDTISANTASIAANIAGNLNTVIWANVTGKPSFATIATTASWDDLVDIPANVLDAVTQTAVDTANDDMIANVTAANARIGQLQANINTLFSNAAVQHDEFGNLRANITAANAAIAAINLSSINANITAANAAISLLVTANTNQGSYIEQNTNRITAANLEIANLRANITAANAAIEVAAVAWVANAGTQQTQINSFNANVNAANAAISALTSSTTANAIAQNSLITALTANTGVLAANINTLFSNAATQAITISTITANIGAFQIYSNANAVTQRTQIINLQENLAGANSSIAALILSNTIQNSIMDGIKANVGNLWVWTDEIDNEVFLLGTIWDQMVLANIANESNIANLQSNTAELASNIAILYANAATQLGQINLVNSNVTAQVSRIDDVYSNIVVRMTDITTLFSNAATQSLSLTSLTSNAATQSVAIASLDANVGRISNNVGTFQSNLATLSSISSSYGDEIDSLFDRVANLDVITTNTAAGLDVANTAIVSAEGNIALITDDIYANLATRVNDITGANIEISSTNSAVGIINNTLDIIDANIGVLYDLLPIGNANITAANVTIAALTVNVQVLESNVSLAQIDITAIQANLGNGTVVYTPNNAAHWNGTISNVAAALDQLAARIWAIENP
jgi:hypothetical protein